MSAGGAQSLIDIRSACFLDANKAILDTVIYFADTYIILTFFLLKVMLVSFVEQFKLSYDYGSVKMADGRSTKFNH